MAGFDPTKNTNKPDIADTGLRGFLRWFKREQPGLYMQLAPTIASGAPQGFSDYNQSRIQDLRARSGNLSMRSTLSFGGFADPDPGLERPSYASPLWPGLNVSYPGLGQMTNVMDDASGMNISNPVTSSFTPEVVNVETPASWQSPTDTVDAANQGMGLPTASSNWIQQLIAGASQAYLTKNQLDTAKSVTALQLQRAQAGLPPLNIDMSKLGVPTVNVGLAPSVQNIVLYGGLAVAALFLFGMIGRRRAAA